MDPGSRVHSVNIGDSNTNCGNISDSFNNKFTIIADDEKPEILRWLSPLEPQNRHRGVRANRHGDVGNWLLEASEFREWRDGDGGRDKAVCWCYGEPGAGKTYLSSLVIDNLCDQARKENIAVACLYCDYNDQHEQTTTNIVGAILKQLVVRDGKVLESVREEFLRARNECGGRGLLRRDLVRILKESITLASRVFICVDALDELVLKELPELLVLLGGIVQELPSVRVFLTGRLSVRARIAEYFPGAVAILISPKPHDLENYLEWKFKMDTGPEEMNNDLRAEILRVVRGSLSESFLLVSLSIDAILGEVTVADRKKKLSEMVDGNGLGDAYTVTLERMKAQKGSGPELGKKALMWVAYSERPLQASELCHALGVEIGPADLDTDRVPTTMTLIRCSLGLITLEKFSDTVRLVHFTLREHLFNNLTLFESPHSMMAEICLTYLNFPSIRKLPPSIPDAMSIAPLAKYASCYWERHAGREMAQSLESLVLRLLDGFDQHISSKILLRYGSYPIELRMWSLDPEHDRFKEFTCLHWTASLGMLEMTIALLKMRKWDLNMTDATGKTAIAWAAGGRHTDILKMLLEQESVNPNIADKNGRTPLSWAAWQGDEEAVKILLERRDIDLDPIHHDGRTPLLWAVSRGHEEVVKLLLEHKDAAFRLVASDSVPATASTKPSGLLRPLPELLRQFWFRVPATYTVLILQILIDCLVISASLCLLVFLWWIVPSLSIVPLPLRR